MKQGLWQWMSESAKYENETEKRSQREMAGSIEYSCNDIEQYVIAPDSDIVYPVNVEIGGNFAYVSGLSNLVGASEGKRDKSNNTDL